jgi:hypothetical protein
VLILVHSGLSAWLLRFRSLLLVLLQLMTICTFTLTGAATPTAVWWVQQLILQQPPKKNITKVVIDYGRVQLSASRDVLLLRMACSCCGWECDDADDDETAAAAAATDALLLLPLPLPPPLLLCVLRPTQAGTQCDCSHPPLCKP